jgi:serine/threonine-protein kinase HipA
MSDRLVVILEDVIAGTLTRLSGGKLRFDYDEQYQERSGGTPLSLSMPIQVRSHPDNVVSPWLWGLLPDNDAVLRRWAREYHVGTSPFSLLGTAIGEDCAGAVRFSPPDEVDRILSRSGHIEWLSDDDVAERLRELVEDSTAWLGRSFTGQFSLAGAQAKTALFHENGRWGVPSGSIPTTHILKPAVSGLDDHDLNEHLCLDAARRAELLAARTAVSQFGDETAVVVERYDRRIDTNGAFLRIHQEDLCQALGFHPSRKYQNEGGPTPPQIGRLLRSAMPAAAAEDAVWRFADALIWNWLIAGTDAHAKNYSLLLAGVQARLAPLYDVASALPYGTDERKLRFAMKIGGDYGVFLRRNTWPGAARDLGLDSAALLDRVRALADVAPDAFAEAVSAPEVAALDRSLPKRLLEIVSQRVAECRSLLDRPSAARVA